MGFSSLLEDIQERLNESHRTLVQLNVKLKEEKSISSVIIEEEKKINDLNAKVSYCLKLLNSCLELATDPSLNQAFEIKQLKEKNTSLLETVSIMRDDYGKTRQRLQDLWEDIRNLDQSVKNCLCLFREIYQTVNEIKYKLEIVKKLGRMKNLTPFGSQKILENVNEIKKMLDNIQKKIKKSDEECSRSKMLDNGIQFKPEF
jgi:hypothetical protein